MSWYVETLLRTRKRIREKLESEEVDFEEFNYSNLLRVEQVLVYLHDNRLLNNIEITIVNDLFNDLSLNQMVQSYNLSRITIRSIIDKVCDKIAFILGAEFTDEGYLEYMRDKYHLDNTQLEKAKKFIESNRRNT